MPTVQKQVEIRCEHNEYLSRRLESSGSLSVSESEMACIFEGADSGFASWAVDTFVSS